MIYLDNAATTKVNDDVLSTFNKVSQEYFANTSSIHGEGNKSLRLLDKAREQIISVLNLLNKEVIFTSGATESNNLAIKGYALRYKNRGNHIIVSSIEHPSILETVKQLEENFGFKVTYLPVDLYGHINPQNLKSSITDDTILVSIMAVNNEIGSINDINTIAAVLKDYPKIVFHIDAVQSFGKINIDYSRANMITFTSHKIHGLNGVGALIKDKNIDLLSLNSGGGQENGYRSGTSPLALQVAFSKAIRLAYENMNSNYNKVLELRNVLMQYLMQNLDEYELNSSLENPYIVNFSLKNKKASVVVEALSNKGIMVSSISACHSRNEKGSYVVKAIGKEDKIAMNTIRVSFDPSNNIDEIKYFINELDKIMKEIKSND